MNSCQIYYVQYSILQSLLCILFAFKINLIIQQEPAKTIRRPGLCPDPVEEVITLPRHPS